MEKKYLLMFENRRKTHLIEREGRERGAVYKRQKKNFILKRCMCSTAVAPHIHALLNLPLYALRRDISPSMYLILLFSPGLTPPDYFFSPLYPPFLDDFHVFLCGALQVFPAKLFPEAERGTFRFCQRAFSSWRRSSRGNSQMMTAIVKGQISPCGFASDCMFISF